MTRLRRLQQLLEVTVLCLAPLLAAALWMYSVCKEVAELKSDPPINYGYVIQSLDPPRTFYFRDVRGQLLLDPDDRPIPLKTFDHPLMPEPSNHNGEWSMVLPYTYYDTSPPFPALEPPEIPADEG